MKRYKQDAPHIICRTDGTPPTAAATDESDRNVITGSDRFRKSRNKKDDHNEKSLVSKASTRNRTNLAIMSEMGVADVLTIP